MSPPLRCLVLAFATVLCACTASRETARAPAVERAAAPSMAVTTSGGPPAAPRIIAERFEPFGRVVRMDETEPLSTYAAVRVPVAGNPPRYARFHERRRARIGFGYLSILDLSEDERFLLVASEDEAKLRTYEFPSLVPVAARAVPGFVRFERADFVFAPRAGSPPAALFASELGISLVAPRGAEVTALVGGKADTLRWTDDRKILGAGSAAIPEQRSRLVFYAPANDSLAPLLTLDFAERVDDWELDSTRTKLAVTYYPSDEIEVLDLAARRVVWVAKAPQYSGTLDISPDDSRLAVGGNAVVVHDMASGRPIATETRFGNNIHDVRFSPRGDALAVSSYEGKLRIFDATGQGPALLLVKLLRHTGTANVYAVLFSKDGSTLISGSGDRTVRVWGE